MEVIGIDYGGKDRTVYCTVSNAGGALTVIDAGEMRQREVNARRARKLRKRGVRCVYSHSTCNGKSRYTWWQMMTHNVEVSGCLPKDKQEGTC
jgi:hypothetical protein